MTEYLLHLDFETTGIHPKFNSLLEAGVIFSDANFTILETIDTLVRPVCLDSRGGVIWEDGALALAKVNGLADDIEEGLAAGTLPTLSDLNDRLLALFDKHVSHGDTVVLSGSGIAKFDSKWVDHYLPDVASRLVYWPNDVGVVRRSYRRAIGTDLTPVNQDKTHRAYDDVLCHFEEQKVFHAFFKAAVAALGPDAVTTLGKTVNA